MTAAAILPSLGLVPEIAVAAIPGDERVWVPQAADVWFRPLLLNTAAAGAICCACGVPEYCLATAIRWSSSGT